MYLKKILKFLILFFIIYQLTIILISIYTFMYKYFFASEVDFIERYGEDTWACITGCSSGQGKQFALKLAERKFNILLIGRKGIYDVENIIKQKYNVKTKCIVKDFCNSFKKNFFNDIKQFINSNNIAILINNVGHRTAWKPYHEMPEKLIKNTISVGTLVQARMIQLVIPKFLERSKTKKSAIINITAQCMHPNIGFGVSNEISVPFLSAYEATNAFGFYHSNSVYKEYKNKKYNKFLDYLTITPGAVVTENTKFLDNTLFNISGEQYVQNILKLLGNVQGIHNAHWGHYISTLFINFAPFLKDKILYQVGDNIAENIMKKKNIV